MPKKLTVNEMIYNTLTTKITKEPKYKEILEALGYELIKDHEWSHYDCWGIRMAEEDRVLVISKGYDNKRHLYATTRIVNTKDIKKVDFENLIKTNRSATRWWNMQPPKTKIDEYKRVKDNVKIDLAFCKDYEKKVAEAEEVLIKVKGRLAYWEELVKKEKERLDKIIAEIRK